MQRPAFMRRARRRRRTCRTPPAKGKIAKREMTNHMGKRIRVRSSCVRFNRPTKKPATGEWASGRTIGA